MYIYATIDYRKVISESLQEKKSLNRAFTFQKMAEFMRIQKSYLSKVINNRADFSSDQLFMAAKFLEFNKDETEYLFLLIEYERSTFELRRNELFEKIESIQAAKRNSKEILGKEIKNMDAETFDNSSYIEYYLDPIVLIVHMFLTIPKFKENISLIASELQISKIHLNQILTKLINMKLIEMNENTVKVIVKNMHLPSDSQIVSSHHQLLHQLSLYRKIRTEADKKKCFSVTFSSNKEVRKKMEIEFNTFISKIKELSSEGKKVDCYQLNFDLFPWSSESS